MGATKRRAPLPPSVLRLVMVFLLMLGAVPVQVAHGQSNSVVRFVVFGDTVGGDQGVNTIILSELVQATLAEDADFVLVAGDLADGNHPQPQLTHWRDIMQPLYNAGIGVYPVRGNHDSSFSKTVWDAVFSGTYALPGNGPSGETNITYSFTYGNVLVIALDEFVNLDRINQAWLDAQLAANTRPHVFAFGHLPAFSVRHTNTLASHPTDRDIFWNRLAAAGVRVYFAGHDHFYNHARLDDGDGNPADDAHQFVGGTGGEELYTWDGIYRGNTGSWMPKRVYYESDYGYTLVEVDGLQATLTWKHRVSPGVYQATGDVFSYAVIPLIKPPSSVLISGPSEAVVNTRYVYSATISPSDATLPITYTWTPPPRGGQGTAAASYRWSIAEPKKIGVVAQNVAGAVTATYAVVVSGGSPTATPPPPPSPPPASTLSYYLPAIFK